MRESQLEAAFRDRVRRMGGITEKIAPTHVGMPDRLVLLPGGKVHLVELKAEGGHLRAAQEVWIARAAQLGVTVSVLTGPVETAKWLAQRLAEIRTIGDPVSRRLGGPAR